MPNWVRNKITFTGKEEDVQKLKDFVKSDESSFDFNKIIPMPEELNMTAGSDEHFAIRCAQAWRKGLRITSFYDESTYEKEQHSFEEWAKIGEQYLSNIEKYGASTWYDWHINNWGTKWNSCEPSWNGDSVDFDTAWDTCEPIYRKLAELFPDVHFDVDYANEDYSAGNGQFSYDGSFWVNEIDTPYFACQVWDYDYEEFLREQEEYANY